LIGAGIFIFTFLILRPSDPVKKWEYSFWNNAASFFGDIDVEGFVGLVLLIICPIITFVGYKMMIKLIERHMNNV